MNLEIVGYVCPVCGKINKICYQGEYLKVRRKYNVEKIKPKIVEVEEEQGSYYIEFKECGHIVYDDLDVVLFKDDERKILKGVFIIRDVFSKWDKERIEQWKKENGFEGYKILDWDDSTM